MTSRYGYYYRRVVAPTTVAITGVVPPGGGPEAAMPEPGSWALMILGFCLAGVAFRRRPSPVRVPA